VVIINAVMITLPYSLIIEATEDPDFLAFIPPIWKDSPESVIRSKIVSIKRVGEWQITHQMLRDQGLSVPAPNPNPTIVIQNEAKLQAA
jgi:hypothetical protein